MKGPFSQQVSAAASEEAAEQGAVGSNYRGLSSARWRFLALAHWTEQRTPLWTRSQSTWLA